ncbi:MAG: hypothetical protein IJB90_03060 [Clostridia bacterium]|nr:hypothetical protein [Clostridia bacterium]
MSNSKLSPKEQEELNKLENEAIIELYQIIALAHQTQDLDYLDSMISAWKYKYKKILDNPSPDFRKKIEKLLNESYSKVVEYILSQIKLKEEKKIENQRKALRELYKILSDNYDYDIVIDKIKKWETKYPYDSFLKMYQKRIDLAKREKNIEQYAFKQEEAFKDLYYGVVNRSGSLEELKEYLHKWEEKYSINDKFTIDDFIKHQSEVKRYTSDEFLISISKKDDMILDNMEPKSFDSSPEAQYSAYKRLESILKGKNNIDEIFKWVYENNYIKFNDCYKQRIIQIATYFDDYSPKHLKTLPIPDIDLKKPALSIEEYNKIDEIKRYAVISYFNLLLPPTEAVSNNFFTENIRTIYYESERRKHINVINTFKDEVTNFIPKTLKKGEGEKETDLVLNNTEIPTRKETITTSDIGTTVLDIEKLIFSEGESHTVELITHCETPESTVENPSTSKRDFEDCSVENLTLSDTQTVSYTTKLIESYKTDTTESILYDNDTSKKSDIVPATSSVVETELVEEAMVHESAIDTYSTVVSRTDSSSVETEPSIDYNTIIAFSPSFFEIINNYSIQAQLVQNTANKATKKFEHKTSSNKVNGNKIRNQSE